MRANGLNLTQDYRGEWWLALRLEKAYVPEAMRMMDTLCGKLLDVTIKQHRKKRSLTANAYFHALTAELAAAMQISVDDCKRMMVCSYGTIAEVDGEQITITLPKGAKADDYYPYYEWLFGTADSDTYALYKQTHAMNSKEFARLIDGVVGECKAVGIETLPPDELRRLYAQADEKNSDKRKR